MIRTLLLIIANMALPFILFYARNTLYKLYYKYKKHDEKAKVPELNLEIAIKLIVAGLILLTIVLGTIRLNAPIETRDNTNQVHQENYR